jgi:thiol-disulfide isomerase/thioredoxin
MIKRPWLVALMLVLVACGDEQLPLADGSYTRLSEWEGRVVVINYWAEWCAPCRKEIPEFNRLYAEAGAGGPLVVGVNYDELRVEDLKGVIDRMAVRFPTLLHNPFQLLGIEKPETLPTTIVRAADGSITEVMKGPQTLESLRAAVERATRRE